MSGAGKHVVVNRAKNRFATQIDWLDSHHSFSFGHHYHPANTHHGLLMVNNDDRVRAGNGFGTHPHRDMEIVTWVLSGELEHRDSEGHHGVLYPGLAQRMSAGTGIFHSEMNPSRSTDAHFIQMWVPPDERGIAPGYQQLDINAQLAKGGLVPIASGQGHDAAITIHQRDAVLWGARLVPGEKALVPAARFAHVFVALGDTDFDAAGAEPTHLEAGDGVRLTESDAWLTAGPTGAEILIWVSGSEAVV